MSASVVIKQPANDSVTKAAYSSLVLGTVLLASIVLPLPGANGRILGMPSICAFYEITRLPCPGCGMTRSFVCFAHGHFIQAFHWNLLGPPLWLAFAFLLIRALLTFIYKRPVLPFSSQFVKIASWSSLAVFVVFGISRIVWLAVEHQKF